MASFLGKAKLLKGLCGGDTAFTGPFYATLDLTRRCNLRCVGCRYHAAASDLSSPGDQTIKDISFDLLEGLAEDFKAMGTKEVVISSEGEPLLYPKFIEAIRLFKEAGLRLTLLTNGILLDRPLGERLVDLDIDVIKVTLWANSLEEYARVYPSCDPANFERVLKNVRDLVAAKGKKGGRGPVIFLHQPVNKLNVKNVRDRLDLARETGCDVISFSPLKTMFGEFHSQELPAAEEKNLRDVLLDMKRLARRRGVRTNVDQTLLRYKIGPRVWEKFPCYIGWIHARVKVDGTVLSCDPSDWILGDLKRQRLREIWNGAEYRNFRKCAMTRDGLTGIAKRFDCSFCCLLNDNMRVHRIFKYLRPLRYGR